jgi:DNA-binding NtrC family response regulator/tetratricopeptide (TPR) repeat protein
MQPLADLAMAGEFSRCTQFQARLEAASSTSPLHELALNFFSAHFALRQEESELAELYCSRGRSLALSRQWESETAGLCLVKGTIHYRRGEYLEAQCQYEEAIIAARRAGMPQIEGRASMNLGLAHKNSGDLAAAERLLRSARETVGTTDTAAIRARCDLNLASVLTRRGEWAEALELACAARREFERLDLVGYLNSARIAEARVVRLQGNPAEARALLVEALDEARRSGKPRNVVIALEFLGDCELDLGDAMRAREHLREALILARGHGKATDLVVECSRGLAAAELACGESSIAFDLIVESSELAKQQRDTFELANSLLVQAATLEKLGRALEAKDCLLESRKIATRSGDKFSQGRAALELSRHAIEQGRLLDAIELSGEARGLFGLIGADAQLQSATLVLRAMTTESKSEIARLVEPAEIVENRRSDSGSQLGNPIAGFLTVDPRVRRTLSTIATLAPQTLNILVLGESGTGKELIAQAVHDQSGRKGSFVPVNCSAFPGDLIEGELFGHARGAYTGADRERVGLFEYAHKGTLFLDEIGDMPVKAQARLLRALENGEVRRLGENNSRTVDVRVVAATHRHLLEMVGAGEFRLDLYYRLAGYVVDLPPVRERKEDAKLLIDHFLARFAKDQGKTLALGAELRQELAVHSWPGNVREIKMVMQRLVSLTPSGTTIRKLPFNLEGDPRPRSLPELLEAEEKKRILDALQAHNWNKARAASTLGTNRTTLIGKMKRMGIELSKQR